MDFVPVTYLLTFSAFMLHGDSSKEHLQKRSKRKDVYCTPKSLVKYHLVVHTLWSKQTFPKMYPTYRPHAQWSPLVGRTHDPEHQMWAIGANATLGVKMYAEQGVYSTLDAGSAQGYNGVLDSVVAPAINSGVGQTSCVVVLDGHHSKLSFMMKIIPSPDWFIGASNLDLCARGRWKHSLHVDLYPHDAGTDQGLTFTSPNWPSLPAEPVSEITSYFPNHPASSFMYSEYKRLPRLAYLNLDLVTEYKQRKTFTAVPKNRDTTGNKNRDTTGNKNSGTTENKNSGKHKDVKIRGNETSISNATADNRALKEQHPDMRRRISKSASSRLGSYKTTDEINIDSDHSNNDGAQNGHASTVPENSSVDCQVGQWSEWSPCSQTCGLGQHERSRNMYRYPRNGGANCPLLRERDVCCSMRNCEINRFTFLEENSPKKNLRSGQSRLGRVWTKKTSVESPKV